MRCFEGGFLLVNQFYIYSSDRVIFTLLIGSCDIHSFSMQSQLKCLSAKKQQQKIILI